MKLHKLFSVLLFFASFNSSAEKLTFPVHGLKVAPKESVPIDFEWDENQFVVSDPKIYNHSIARLSALLSTISYVHVEDYPESNEMLETYKILGFNENDIVWNYNLDYSQKNTENDQAAYSFAVKDIKTPDGTKKLVFLIVRGTPLSANEWLSNLNISDSSKRQVVIHEGFLSTCMIIKDAFYKFLEDKQIPSEDSYFLVTGHSRGAALANLLGAIFLDEQQINTEKLFVYTFASPNVTQDEKASDEKYSFIWNIVNAEDLVPTIPPNRKNWKWKKFGNTRFTVNFWNCEPDLYMNNYYPRMNEYYKKLLLRNYSPFKIGPFLQIQASRVLTSVYKDIKHYYWHGFHFLASSALKLAFPDETKDNSSHKKEKGAGNINENGEEGPEIIDVPFFLKPLRNDVNKHIDNGFEYLINAAIDMHACESYLSWILALDENELFSTLGSSEIVIDGALDCAVYDDEGNMLARIINGAVELYSLKVPVCVMPLPYHNVLGFPGNQNVNVIIHKDSLFPTVLGYKIEHYDVGGNLLDTSEKSHFFPYSNLSIKFEAGKSTLKENSLQYEKLTRKEAKPLIKKYELNENFKFRVQGEAAYTFDKNFNLGLRIGAPAIYGSLLGEFHSKNSYGFSSGIGHQHIIYGRVLFDTEIFTRYVWTENSFDKKEFNLVPGVRLALSYKPLRRGHYFLGFAFNTNIKDYNDLAFSKTARKTHFPSFNINDDISIYPSFQIGVRY